MPMRFQVMADWSPGYINVCPPHVTIMAECTACGKTGEFDKETLPKTLQHALIRDIEKRMKCLSCGAKTAKLRFGYYMGGDGDEQ
jgi:hypothetical protein